MRLVVPYLLGPSACLHIGAFGRIARSTRHSPLFRFSAGPLLSPALRFRIPVLHRIAAPASALLVLNAAAVVGLYKFLFTRGPLWKIWNSNAASGGCNAETENSAPPEPFAAAAANDRCRIP
jgi:hypothetical protein